MITWVLIAWGILTLLITGIAVAVGAARLLAPHDIDRMAGIAQALVVVWAVIACPTHFVLLFSQRVRDEAKHARAQPQVPADDPPA